MARSLVLVHTVKPMLDVFDKLGAEYLPGVQLLHVLDEILLERVRLRGHLAPEDADQLRSYAIVGEQIGAGAMLVTCSTLSPCVDDVRPHTRLSIMKIDEAMVAEAVRLGSSIGIIATSLTTLEPTRQQLVKQAQLVGKEIETESVLVNGALPALLSGDGRSHDEKVKLAILDMLDRKDVIVLAQASMSRVLDVLPLADRSSPILASPPIALKALQFLLVDQEPCQTKG